jgi:two-component system cell cycle sensor histidine kinase/response regulator CckA
VGPANTNSAGHALAMSSGVLMSVLQSVADGVIVTDSEGRIEFLNRAAERLIGTVCADAVGWPLHEVLRLEERQGRSLKGDLVELAILSEAPVALGSDLILNTNSGPPKQVEGEVCVRNTGGMVTGAVVTFRDVTARNMDEARKREEQKMRAVGQLAGAVAHSVNNLLTVIVGSSEAADELCQHLEPLRAPNAEIRRASGEIAAITRQLIALSGRELLIPEVTNLNRLIEKLRLKLTNILPPGIELTISLQPNLGPVLLDPSQMEQALLDLVGYCRDRMPGGGVIEVAAANIISGENQRSRHLRRFVELAVKDEGPSLRHVPLEQLFEPTWTREPGRPSGLGLFTVRSVVNAAKGYLSVESEADLGAKFVLRLLQAEEEEQDGSTSSADVLESEHPTILLVEDDDGIRILLRNSLEKQNYRVLEARDGAEAMLQAELHEDPIDLLITDVVMPVMGGPALARELVKTRAGLKVLLISGCSDDVSEVRQLVVSGAHFVQKPFSQRELMDRVSSLLSGGDVPPITR